MAGCCDSVRGCVFDVVFLSGAMIVGACDSVRGCVLGVVFP